MVPAWGMAAFWLGGDGLGKRPMQGTKGRDGPPRSQDGAGSERKWGAGRAGRGAVVTGTRGHRVTMVGAKGPIGTRLELQEE